MKYFIVDAFTDQSFGGNPAGVVLLDGDTAAGDGHTAHVRDFAPLYDIPEESATGTANAALTHYLQQNGRIPSTGDFSFLQGEAMGRPSVVATRISGDGVIYVGGTATIVAKGELMV